MPDDGCGSHDDRHRGSLHYRGNFEHACKFLKEEGYIAHMLGKSRFNRRLHRIQDLFLTLFRLLGATWKDLNDRSVYVIDSYPIASCDNYRICRPRRYHGEAWRGYHPSKKRYFYGLKIHIIVTEHGQTVEFFLTPGGTAIRMLTHSSISTYLTMPGYQAIRFTLITLSKTH